VKWGEVVWCGVGGVGWEDVKINKSSNLHAICFYIIIPLARSRILRVVAVTTFCNPIS
jgi:hypothetical protein